MTTTTNLSVIIFAVPYVVAAADVRPIVVAVSGVVAVLAVVTVVK